MSQSIKAFPWPYKRRASILSIRARKLT